MTNKEKFQFIILIILLLIVAAVLYWIFTLVPEDIKQDSLATPEPTTNDQQPTTLTPLPIPTPILTPSPTSTPTPIPNPSPTPVPTPTSTPSPTPTPTPIESPSPTPTPVVGEGKVQLAVPYISEAPDGIWSGPWKNACEEASITMIEKYYNGIYNPSIQESKDFMWMLFTKQNELWGSNADADAYRTDILINDYTSYNSQIVLNPTIEQIKAQIDQGNPVVSFHYGKLLYNPGIPFLATGSYYHVMVIIGYDDTTGDFITHDDGDIKTGVAHRYEYGLFMNSLADFSFARRAADGPPTVIFTFPK